MKSTTLLILFAISGATAASAGFNPSPVQSGDVYKKNITKAECLKKPGYVWIEADKVCIKPSRGSH